MPIPHSTMPFTIRCSAANASIEANRSSPSSSFAMTTSPSAEDCILAPRLGLERLRLHLELPRNLPRELVRMVEHRVNAPGPAVLHELEEVVEVRVVAQGELRVQPVRAREVVHRAPPAHERGAGARHPCRVLWRRAKPTAGHDVDAGGTPLFLGELRGPAV